MSNNLPNFLIIGAQKCGTSWLHRHLGSHPQIHMPAAKELEFFSYAPHLENPGFEHYLESFAGGGQALAIGEASTSYFWTASGSPWCIMPEGFQPQIPHTVHRYLGSGLKLILSLRNPLDRALSAFGHYLAHKEIAAGTPWSQARYYGGIVDMGFYYRHLQQWRKYFSPDQFLIIDTNEDIVQHPKPTLNKICEFLEVDTMESNEENLRQPVFPGTLQRNRTELGIELISPPDPGATNKAPAVKGFINNDELEQLKALYRNDVLQLDEILGGNRAEKWG